MEKIDSTWLKKFQKIVDTKERSVKHNEARCEKEIFVNRVFRMLENRAFKIKINSVIHYALFIGYKTTIGNESYFHTGINFYLGWSSHQYSIKFLNEKCSSTTFKLHYNQILDIEYEEISLEKYYEIVKLFT